MFLPSLSIYLNDLDLVACFYSIPEIIVSQRLTWTVGQIASAVKPQEVHQKLEPSDTQARKGQPGGRATPMESEAKVEYATDFLNKLSMEEAKENDPKLSAANNLSLGRSQSTFFT